MSAIAREEGSTSTRRSRRFPWARALAVLPIPALAISAPAGASPAIDSLRMAPGPLVLRLNDALVLAAARNWDLAAAGAAVAIAEAGARTAREWPNPQVVALTSHIHADGHDATPLGNDLDARAYDSVVQWSQLVEIGGKRGARRRSAGAAVEAARARQADTRRTLDAAVTRAYVAAALAEADARIARESAGYLRGEARIAATRFEAGDISRSDRDQIEIAAARLELDAASAAATARAQRIALETLLGLPAPAGDVVLADSLEALAAQADAPPEGFPSGERADVAAARADLTRAEGDLRLQRAARMPDPTLIVQAEHEPPDRPNTVGAGVSFPLPLWSRNAGAIAAAQAARDDAARSVGRAVAEAAADLAAARVALEESAARWHRYRDDLRPRSEQIRRSVSLAYEKGGASLLDLLEAQRNDNDVRMGTMQAASDAASAAAALAAALTPYAPGARR